MRQAEPPSGAGGADADTAQCDVFKRCEGSSPLRTQNVKSNFGSSYLPFKRAPHSTTTRYFSGSLSLSHNKVNTLSTAFFIMFSISASVLSASCARFGSLGMPLRSTRASPVFRRPTNWRRRRPLPAICFRHSSSRCPVSQILGSHSGTLAQVPAPRN
jgi:hypothetical protein